MDGLQPGGGPAAAADVIVLSPARPTPDPDVEVVAWTPSPAAAAAAAPALFAPPPAAAAAPPPPDPLRNLSQITMLFPTIDVGYAKDKLVEFGGDANALSNWLFEDGKGYPKQSSAASTAALSSSSSSSAGRFAKEVDFLSAAVVGKQQPMVVVSQTTDYLISDFSDISVGCIRRTVARFKGHYAASRQWLTKARLAAPQGSIIAFEGHTIKILRHKRRRNPPPHPCAELLDEVAFYHKHVRQQREDEDLKLAMELNEQEYEANGSLLECGCCFGEYSFESMVQCSDGHLFCKDCVRRYCSESAFGEGKTTLTCMAADGCKSNFPIEQLRSALPPDLFAKLQSRQQEESLMLAGMEGLVRCPKPDCTYAVVMEGDDNKVFECQNPRCMARVCRLCNEDWDEEHIGKPCSEVERKSDLLARTQIEEEMTKAMKRACHRCGTAFFKIEGCNKMTCRCGAKQCYVCRADITKTGYSHFCQHPLTPGVKCTKCNACSLWTDAAKDDEQAVREAKEAATRALQLKDPDLKRKVPPPPEGGGGQPKKKARVAAQPAPAPHPVAQPAPPNYAGNAQLEAILRRALGLP